MVLLWTLLVIHFAITIFLVGWSLHEGREASVFIAGEPRFRDTVEKAKARFQKERDIEFFRTNALEQADKDIKRNAEDGSGLQQYSEAILLASLIPATTFAALAYALYGLRKKGVI